jgi:enoyl-CoA hydratase
MDTAVSYQLRDSIATITMDDGKVNVLSPAMLGELDAALDRAAADRAVVVLSGRPGIFSAGFDLSVLNAGGARSAAMVEAGFALAERLLSFPMPVVIACTGHAVAMGVFLLLSGDYRVGAAGPYKFVANEVAIGLTIPRAAIEILRQRLTPAEFTRAATLAEPFSPDNAVQAGFLDRVVSAADVHDVARGIAEALAALDMNAHLAAKLLARQQVLAVLRSAIDADNAELRARLASGPRLPPAADGTPSQ